MLLADPARWTLFPPARWAGRTAVVELHALAEERTGPFANEDFDRLERDLRAIMVRRVSSPAIKVLSP
ncbi:MAG TPA: hypothetical protein VHD36_18100 [Pirellulales bacterium]|nr:hypothetical protein [Pirellulales bacterium]